MSILRRDRRACTVVAVVVLLQGLEILAELALKEQFVLFGVAQDTIPHLTLWTINSVIKI
jgi:hypothetical protein